MKWSELVKDIIQTNLMRRTDLRGPPSLIPFTTSALHHLNLLAERYSLTLPPHTNTHTHAQTHTHAWTLEHPLKTRHTQTHRVIQADSSRMTVHPVNTRIHTHTLRHTQPLFFFDSRTHIPNTQPIFAADECRWSWGTDGHVRLFTHARQTLTQPK